MEMQMFGYYVDMKRAQFDANSRIIALEIIDDIINHIVEEKEAETQDVSKKGGSTPSSSTPCQDTGENVSTPTPEGAKEVTDPKTSQKENNPDGLKSANSIMRGFVEIRNAPQPIKNPKIMKKENTPIKVNFKRKKPPPPPKIRANIKKFEAQKSMMMEYLISEKSKETPIVREKGGPLPPSSTPCQDSGTKLSTPSMMGGCRNVQSLRTSPIEREKGGLVPPPSTPCQETVRNSSTPPPVGGYKEVHNLRTTPTETPPSPQPGPDRIENLPSYLSNTGQPIGENRSKRPPNTPPASTTLKFGVSSRQGAEKVPRIEIRDGSGLDSMANVQNKPISKISSKINFFKNLENTRNSDKHHKLSLGPDGLARRLDKMS